MTEEELYQAIFKRKSVRKVEAAPLDEATISAIRSFIATLRPMFPEIRTELKFMTSDEVRGMFKVNAPHYLGIFSEEKSSYAANAGFLLQQVDLFLSANDIGCCWQGGPKPTKKVRSGEGLEYVMMIAFGRPAEPVHRHSIAEFKRGPIHDITDVKGSDAVLEAARLAPSGMNNQSWYFTGGNGTIHAHSAKSLVLDSMNRVNVGIALCHMWLAATHEGKKVEFVIDHSAEAAPPKGFAYNASMMLK
jgi:Putative TM nitroreductase